MKRTLMLFSLLTGLIGCFHIGQRTETFEPAQNPGGIRGTFSISDRAFEAELLEVSDSAFLVLDTDRRVRLLPYATVRRADFPKVASVRIAEDGPPSPAQREQLRLVSRYPQALPPEVLRALLTVHGQAEIDVARP